MPKKWLQHRHRNLGYCKRINRWIQQAEEGYTVIIVYCVVCCNQINKKSLKIGAMVLRPRKLTPTWAPLQQDLRVCMCVRSTALIGPVSRLLCDQWMGFHWQSITSPTPTRRRHHHLLCRHTQTPPMAAQKDCQQKWKMVYSEHRPADTTRMKGTGIVHGPMHQGRYKREDYAVVWKMEGEIESKRRGNIVTQTQRLCVSGQTLIWFPFFPA